MVKGVKQTKVGFDKNFAQKQEVDRPLVGVRGNILRDQNGEFLYTKDEEAPPAYFAPEKSMPSLINNRATPDLEPYFGSIAIEEQFPLLSEVSTSLLGIPRKGKQQSLLADVSVYGLDEDTWEYQYFASGFAPPIWGQRDNPTYGRRFRPRLTEYEKESALALEMFPVPFGFPEGPNFADGGSYEAVTFTKYLRFVELGNLLYDYFLPLDPLFANNNFLPKDVVTFVGTINLGNSSLADVDYGDQSRATFGQIEKWTLAWMDIRDNIFVNPIDNELIDAQYIANFLRRLNKPYEFADTQPGYEGATEWYAQLTSKEAFRYQPGAISGYTYGLRLNADPSTESTSIEWGAVNETDHYCFQVTGSKFNVVRRSTVALSAESLALMGKLPEDQVLEDSPNPLERTGNPDDFVDNTYQQLYTTVWGQDDFNGDGLNGAGKSGYTISFNEVTMYKIEFSWYGAIGAKFYAYIPVGNGEARWVLIHTILIENLLEAPSLKNPFMKFRYSINCKNQESLRAPIYVYKYGASYYIDGDDEGAYTYNNYSGQDLKPITSFNSTPIMGFYPKDQIKNSDGVGTDSQKNFYIDKLNITANTNTRVDLLQCEGCQNGFGHYYAPSIVNGTRATTERFRVNAAGNLTYVQEGRKFTQADNGKHIVADGIYCSYLYIDPLLQNLDDFDELEIARRTGKYDLGSENTPLPVPTVGYDSSTLIATEDGPRGVLNYEFEGKIVGYDDIVASIQPTQKSSFTVQFLNPQERYAITRERSHYKQFRIGVTTQAPSLETVDGVETLLFGGNPLDYENELWSEYVPYQPDKDITGLEAAEVDPRYGEIFQQDPRIDLPVGVNSGLCSELFFKLIEVPVLDVVYDTNFTEILEDNSTVVRDGNFIIFNRDPNFYEVTGGEIGIYDGVRYIGSGVTFTGDIVEFTALDGSEGWWVEISGPIDLTLSVQDEGFTTIAFKFLQMTGRHTQKVKAYGYSDTEFYIWIGMEDEARINNITINEYDQNSSNTFIPNWIKDSSCNITVDNTAISDEGFDAAGRFEMGGASSTNLASANFQEYNRLDSVVVDSNLAQPLRPAFIKSSFFVGTNQTEVIPMDFLFNIDRFKLTTGTFNNTTFYLSGIAVDAETNGNISVNVNGREQ